MIRDAAILTYSQDASLSTRYADALPKQGNTSKRTGLRVRRVSQGDEKPGPMLALADDPRS
jgi:hypothetical protein